MGCRARPLAQVRPRLGGVIPATESRCNGRGAAPQDVGSGIQLRPPGKSLPGLALDARLDARRQGGR